MVDRMPEIYSASSSLQPYHHLAIHLFLELLAARLCYFRSSVSLLCAAWMGNGSDCCAGSKRGVTGGTMGPSADPSSAAFHLVTSVPAGGGSSKETSGHPACIDWTVWQLLDSLLPTGGFAHSFGLEAAVQTHLVTDSATLEEFLVSSLEGAAALMLPFVFVAHKLPTTDCWIELDKLFHATATNQVVRKASQAQGTALLRLAATVFVELPEVANMRARARRSDTVYVHYAPLFGSLCGLLGWDALSAQRSFLFLTLRDIVSAGTRLNVVGPLEAAYLQHRLSPVAEGILSRYANRPIRDAFQTAPVLDTVQGCHQHLYSRLFCS